MSPSSQPKTSPELRRLVLSVLQPGFVGTEAPDWLLRAIAGGLSSVVLFGRNISTPEQVARLAGQLRAENPELVIAIDEEAGDVTRLESWTGSTRPGNFALGAVDDVELTESVARDIGRELHAAGVSLDYAPSADVNSNPSNPVIGVRSFGAAPDLVARHTAAWIRGLQDAGVAACAKHFPGHGDTAVDSHHGLPSYDASIEEIAATALPPFRAAMEAGVRVVMTGHLLVPAYDREHPATLSRAIIGDLLRGELGFDGMVVTDAIEMGAVADRYGLGGAAAGAIIAGCDAVCTGGERADEAFVELLSGALLDAVAAGGLSEERLREASGRVRAFAAWSTRLGRTVPTDTIRGDIGFAAARRAIRLSGPADDVLPIAAAPHVVELVPTTNLAIGKETPWGVATPLRERMPGTTFVRVGEGQLASGGPVLDELVLKPSVGRPLVVVVRDASRLPWMGAALDELVRARPDAIVVEMGLPGAKRPGAVHIVTHGATTASGVAAAETLLARRSA
ncbi:glycoside hydrolase family 3 protein [Streptacidiphilus jiangxiensis]|uniref:Beta-N-acetylhexosaminidase n=1 Tax=Streptacidiphilus jiangxiensis TaxID=235985 RepID=A0A1H7X2W1_STRJI|nr:glycoside hydrolase family 3 N-terminal domain-containing protein [Streptacidiphilus jiangxiensis]SEM28216.1 beta-N-acetylhexosaminidase [Streptacidiphilus jiangxiensis]